MKGVIVQPSFLPWRGFFDLIHQADVFVLFDDVQYDKRSWRNRNKIKTPQGTDWISVPVMTKGAFTQNICETRICNDTSWALKVLRTISYNYARAPYFKEYFPLFEEVLQKKWDFLVDLDQGLMALIMDLLDLKTKVLRSSQLEVQNQDKVSRLIAICKTLGVDHYLTGPTAKDYIGAGEDFVREDIQLEYANYDYPSYPQLHGEFEPYVSVIDLLFNVGPAAPQYIWKIT